MARVNVHVPDELAALVRERMPGLNVSQVLQDALRARVDCTHAALVCSCCGANIERAAIADLALSAYHREAMHVLADPVGRCATAEGAARVLADLAAGWGITAATHTPVPRPSKAQRARARKELVDEAQAATDAEQVAAFRPPVTRPRRRNRAA